MPKYLFNQYINWSGHEFDDRSTNRVTRSIQLYIYSWYTEPVLEPVLRTDSNGTERSVRVARFRSNREPKFRFRTDSESLESERFPSLLTLYHSLIKNKDKKEFNVKIFERESTIGYEYQITNFFLIQITLKKKKDRWQGFHIGLSGYGIQSLWDVFLTKLLQTYQKQCRRIHYLMNMLAFQLLIIQENP